MRKKYIVLSVVLVAVLAIVNTTKVSSNINFVRSAASGDPVNGGLTCAQSSCHASSLPSNANLLTLMIGTDALNLGPLDANFHYAPNTTYYISFQITDPTEYAFGFQFTGLTASNGKADSFTVTNVPHTRKKTYGNINYMSHQNANTIGTWIFQWTSPATAVGPVTFYYAFNPADSAHYAAAQPDLVTYHGSLKIFEVGFSGIDEISAKLANLNVFPNPVNQEFALSFDLKQSEIVSASVYSLDGKLNKELVNDKMGAGNFYRTFNISDLASGIYLVKMNVGDATITKKIIKE